MNQQASLTNLCNDGQHDEATGKRFANGKKAGDADHFGWMGLRETEQGNAIVQGHTTNFDRWTLT